MSYTNPIVTPPAVPDIAPFPNMGESGFNTKAATWASSMEDYSAAEQEIIDSAHDNAVAAEERAGVASAAANTATSAAVAAIAARDDVATIVATLPDGSIIDGAPSGGSAWSSQKTADEIADAVAAGVQEWPPIGGIVQLMGTADTLELDGRLFLRSGLAVHPDDVPDWPAWAVQPTDAFSGVTSGFSGTIRAIAQAGNVWVIAGSSGGMRRSTDNGSTWAAVTSGFSTSQIYGVATDGAGIWIAVGESGKVARSADNGATWAIVSAGFNASYSVDAVATDAAGNWIAVSQYGEVRRSTNNGTTWATVAAGFGTTQLGCVGYGNGVWVVGGYLGAMKRSTDGGTTWAAVTGAGASPLESIATDGAGVWIAGGYDTSGIRRSTDNGATWALVTTATWPGYVVGMTYLGDGVFYACGFNGGLRKSTDAGLTWANVSHGAGTTYLSAIAHNQGMVVIAVGDSAMQRSRYAIGLETYEQYKYLRIA